MAICDICGKHPPQDTIVLVRMNPPGVEGIFRCVPCLGNDLTNIQRETLTFLRDAGLLHENMDED